MTLATIISLLVFVVVVVVMAILSMVTTPTITLATSIGIGNITDGKPRISLIQEEDFSLSLYQTVNGTTIQIAGFDNLMEAVDYFINNELGLEQENLEELQEPEINEEIEEDDNDNGGDDNGDDNEPEPEPEPIIEPGIGNDSDNEGTEELNVITEGCGEGLGYYEDDDSNPKCYPIMENGELQTEPPEGVMYCTALGICPFNPPNLSK
ncbi:MAG: hypothetical protein ACRD8Z_23465 [Nitrososphaeraceae archaeon]